MTAALLTDIVANRQCATLDLNPNSDFMATLNSSANLQKEKSFKRAAIMFNSGNILDFPSLQSDQATVNAKDWMDDVRAQIASLTAQKSALKWYQIAARTEIQNQINIRNNLISTIEHTIPNTYAFWMTGKVLTANRLTHHDGLIPWDTAWWGKRPEPGDAWC